MKKMILLAALIMMATNAFAEMPAIDILKKADSVLYIGKSEMRIEMKVFRNNQLRKTYQMKIKFLGWRKMLSETLYPPRNQGEKVLQTGDESMWLYLPRLNKTMRVSESSTFSNSDFSNMDILNPSLAKDYIPKLLTIETINDQKVYKLELIAKSEDITYAKIIYWVRAKDFYPMRRDYYTFSGYMLKRLIIKTKTDVRQGKPDIFIMNSVLEKNKYTVLRYTKIKKVNSFAVGTFNKDSLLKR